MRPGTDPQSSKSGTHAQGCSRLNGSRSTPMAIRTPPMSGVQEGECTRRTWDNQKHRQFAKVTKPPKARRNIAPTKRRENCRCSTLLPRSNVNSLPKNDFPGFPPGWPLHRGGENRKFLAGAEGRELVTESRLPFGRKRVVREIGRALHNPVARLESWSPPSRYCDKPVIRCTEFPHRT